MSHKILIAEDDHSLLMMYDMKLRMAGYEVILARDGNEAFDIARQYHPHLILLDIRMPQYNGDVVLEMIRAQEWGRSIRVVILTNISKAEAPMKLRLLSVDRYVVKAHHTPSQIVDIVKDVIG